MCRGLGSWEGKCAHSRPGGARGQRCGGWSERGQRRQRWGDPAEVTRRTGELTLNAVACVPKAARHQR